jgi:hypothetical protein
MNPGFYAFRIYPLIIGRYESFGSLWIIHGPASPGRALISLHRVANANLYCSRLKIMETVMINRVNNPARKT